MKTFRDFVLGALVSGLVIVAPTYLGGLVLLRAIQSLAGFVRPLAVMLPDWLPRESMVAFLILVLICFGIGAFTRTRIGRNAMERLEKAVFVRIPGYAVFRGLTHQLVGEARESTWKPAFAEIEDALVPAFIIEELDDGRYTVFVPSVPSPFAGSVYILSRSRVHLVDASFLETFQTLSRWGSGSKHLVAAMHPAEKSQAPRAFKPTEQTRAL